MGYKRAEWHSGLTYSQVCENCNTEVTYTDHKLGFRPWYPDGFVYCPTCNTPLRHNEAYAINRPAEPVKVDISQPASAPAKPSGVAMFCTTCGKAFTGDENFCPKCGSKRIK